MAVDARGFNLVTDIPGSFGRGFGIGQNIQNNLLRNQLLQQQVQQQQQQVGTANQMRDLLTQFTTPQTGQQSLLAEQTVGFNPLGQDQLSQQIRGEQPLSEAQLKVKARQIDPFAANKFFEAMGIDDATQREDFGRFAIQAMSQPPAIQNRMIERRISEIEARRGDATDTRDLLSIPIQNRGKALETIALSSLSVKDQLAAQRGSKPQIKEGIGPGGKPGFFSVTPEGATQVPGIAPIPKKALVEVNTGDQGLSKEQEQLGKLRADELKALRTSANDAELQLQSLDILDSIDVSTGAAEPMKQAVADFGAAFGLDTSGLADVEKGQAFTAEAGKVVLRVLATQKGPQTDADRREIKKTIASLGTRPEANAFINDSARAISNRIVEQRDFFDDWLEETGTLKGASKAWSKKKRETPFISRKVKTAKGLPVFFFRFRDRVREANPGVSDAEIIEAWNRQEAAK